MPGRSIYIDLPYSILFFGRMAFVSASFQFTITTMGLYIGLAAAITIPDLEQEAEGCLT